ncbi:ribosome silencing factor [Candidatus Sumerlaeota bacterium]|nr:ribosome silencing factor [Candidatus Sumerlaeota bacterium]
MTNATYESASERAVAIARLADENKAENVVVLQVGEACNFTDYFVIASCASTLQLRGLGHKIERHLREYGVRPFKVAGYDTATWIVQDFGDVVVHLFSIEARDHYRLEKLWRDGPRVEWAPAPSKKAKR